MANPKHLSKLKEGVQAWNASREGTDYRELFHLRSGHLNQGNSARGSFHRFVIEEIIDRHRFDPLSEMDLSGADLSGLNLSEANLHATDLSEACLNASNLRGASLFRAKLRGTMLSTSNLGDTDFSMADLSGATLRGANLQDSNLTFTNLTGADLNGATLRGACLYGATIEGANFTWADLSGVDLSSLKISAINFNNANFLAANLSGADLSRANCSHTNLSKADLSSAIVEGTIFKEAKTAQTRWINVDLSKALDLDTIAHLAPSSIGVDTFALSKGLIPKEFLQGCGLADWEIENVKLYSPSITEAAITDIQYRVHGLRVSNPIRYYSVFISYSHEDKAFARALHDTLQSFGIRCWLDEKQLLPGDDIHEQIDRGIQHWDKVILCASENSLNSWWVDKELSIAFSKEARIMKERRRKVLALVPVNLDGFLFKWNNGKAEEVRTRFAPDFTAWKSAGFDFSKALEPLIKALRADECGREPIPEPLL